MSLEKSIRYTEGDFHHLKTARIERPPSLGKFKSKSSSIGSSELDPNLIITAADNSSCAAFTDEVVTEISPMLSPVCEESGKTQVLAEVHKEPIENRGETIVHIPSSYITKNDKMPVRSTPSRHKSPRHNYRDPSLCYFPPTSRLHFPNKQLTYTPMKEYGKERQSWSLELEPIGDTWLKESRRVKSYEEDFVQKRIRDNIDYDRYEITEFTSDAYAARISPDSHCKLRYYDIGSFEDIHNATRNYKENLLYSGSESDTLNGSHSYKELWQLRSTLADQRDNDATDSIKDNVSDTLRFETGSSPEPSPVEPEPALSVTTSFESNTEPVIIDQSGTSTQCSSEETVIRKTSSKLLHPNYETRRHTYQKIFNKKAVARRSAAAMETGGEIGKQGDNSFDSFETIDTDGDVSESSRQEFTTTSFESTGTTDNTDSTGDSASHKLQQMRGDSGYKSLETQQSQTQLEQISAVLPIARSSGIVSGNRQLSKKQIQFVFEDPAIVKAKTPKSSSLPETSTPSRHGYSRSSHYFDRRAVKSASKKRRDFRSDRQHLKVQHGIQEGESDSRSDQPSGDSFEEAPVSNKGRFSIFNKIMRTKSDQSPKRSSLSRDFSIDEKTDALFNEFLRHDPKLDTSSQISGKPRLQRKSSEASFESSGNRARQRLNKNNRSTSVDQSTISIVRTITKHSPQDSIEEETTELVVDSAEQSRIEELSKTDLHTDYRRIPELASNSEKATIIHSKKSSVVETVISSVHTKQISIVSNPSRSPNHACSTSNKNSSHRIPIIKFPTLDNTDTQ